MPTILHIGSLRLVIYPNDHDPPHVHLVGPGCTAKIRLGTAKTKPSILGNEGVPLKQMGKALLVVDEQRELLRKAWRKRNG